MCNKNSLCSGIGKIILNSNIVNTSIEKGKKNWTVSYRQQDNTKMKVILLLSLLAIVFFSAPVKAQAGSIGNFCSFYSKALGVNNSVLITTVVNATILQYIANGPLLAFFDGAANNSYNHFSFLGNATAFQNLFLHLVQFFGQVLNCTDGSIGAYSGRTMPQAHVGLAIGYANFALFNQYVLNVLANNGVVASDLTLVAKLLNSLNTQICYNADCQTICNKYSIQGVTNNTALISSVVIGTFTAAINSPILLPFFNGSINYVGVQNYLTNTTAQGILVAHLIQFFGMALGCTDGTIGTYQGVTLTASHNILPINNLAFNTFNNALVGVLAAAGVTAADQATVLGVLNGTRAQVCFAADCFQSTTTAATSKSGASSVVPAVAAVAGALAANHVF